VLSKVLQWRQQQQQQQAVHMTRVGSSVSLITNRCTSRTDTSLGHQPSRQLLQQRLPAVSLPCQSAVVIWVKATKSFHLNQCTTCSRATVASDPASML
jgi:hypothetical protein